MTTPTNRRSFVQHGIALVALGRVDEAAAEFHEAIRLHPFEHGENEKIEILAKIESAYF